MLLTRLIIVLFTLANLPANADDISAYYGFDEMEIIKLDRQIKNLRITDFNRDGRGDIAVVNNRKARIELLIQRQDIGPAEKPATVDPNDIDVNEINPPSRFDKQQIGVSQKIAGFATGDLNSDGMADLAFYGEPPKALYVILQKAGKSTSLTWGAKEKIKIDDGLLVSKALLCADVNSDRRDDLVLAGRDAVYLVLQKDDGSLAAPVKYPTTSTTLGLEIGDLNADGRADLILITADSDKPIHVRFGLATGQLGPQMKFFIEKPKSYTVTISDCGGTDGDRILSVESKSERLSCYRFMAAEPAVGGDSPDWPVLFYPLEAAKESANRDLALGDFDGDGLADLVISDPDAAELILYRQIAGLGLAEPVRFPAFSDITNLSAGDIDADGKDELAVLSFKEKILGVSKFANDRLVFPQPVDLVGEPLAMELADLDSDGKLDCLYVFSNTGDARFLSVIYNPGLRGDAAPKPSHKPLKLEKLLSNPDGLKVLDVDQDGLADCLIFIRYEQPILVRQVKKGRFRVIDSPRSQASLIKDALATSIAVADIDARPGAELLIAQKNFARSLVFADGRKWKIIDQYNAKTTENNISGVGVFDIDSDGALEILLLDGQKGRLQILALEPDKTYRLRKELEPGKWDIKKMLFAALSGGSAKSIVLFDGDKFALITPSPASGTSELRQEYSYETKIKDGGYGQLTTGDINSDGRADIIMVEHKRNHIEILALDQNFMPTPAMRFKVFERKSYRNARRLTPFVEPRELAVADVTGDGKADLVTIIHDRIIIYPQD